MQTASVIVLTVAVLLSISVVPLDGWQIFCIANGMRRYRRLPPKDAPHLSFAVVICARNEQEVIGHLLGSLETQQYPHDLYRVFVVADNCTDATAQVARDAGAVVWERNDSKHIGKGYALNFATRLLADYPETYDALCVFDADNIASPAFLAQIDAVMTDDVDGVTGFRDSKNAHMSPISEAYSIYWYMLMRFYHNPRMHMGLSCYIGGTGFAFRLSSIPGGIWDTCTVTEDLEFTYQRVLEGRRIVFARDAVFYDEQPSDLATAWTQMKRWVMGPKQICWHYTRRVIGSIRRGNKEHLDLLSQEFVPYMVAAPSVAGVLFAVGFFLGGETDMGVMAVIFFFVFQVLSAAFMVGTAYLTLRLNYKTARLYVRGILTYPLVLIITTTAAVAMGLRPHQLFRWEATRHTAITANEELRYLG